ncbi:MAG: efflux RND transporter permease subunit, partial [Calditrichia bacterium]|nr:efflux RND transporter permease subunit [Calditrichia bacterium]
IRERSIYFDNISKSRQDNVVLLSLIKSSDGNTVEMAKGIKKILPVLEAELPAGSNVEIVMDRSIFIESSVEDTLMNIILGILLTGLVLLFFLHDLRSTLIVALSMPFSIISTFLLMQLSGFTMNIMTLMGLSVAVGILVTNSVVVLENIFRHKEMGHSRRVAAETGTTEIMVAVIASTLTNIVVFLPIATMSSLVGQFFKEFALTVTYATIFSLISSFVLTPMLASLILPEKDTKKHPLGAKLEKMFHSWENFYKNLIIKILATKLRSFWLLFSSYLFAAIIIVVLFFQVGAEFFPALDEGDISIEVELPQGYNLQQSAVLVNQIENRIKQYDEVKHILTSLGSITQMDKGTNMAKIAVKLIDVEQRDITSNEAASKFIEDLSDIPNAMIRVAAVSSGGGGEEAPITFHLQGQELAKLETYKRELVKEMKKIPGLVNLNTSSRPGKPEITLIPKRKKIADAGLNIYAVAMTLRSAIEGMVVTQYREEGNEYDIRVCLTDESVNSPEEVGNITVLSPNGRYRMSQLVDIQFT